MFSEGIEREQRLEMVNVNMIRKDGLHLTKNGRAMLENHFLKYFKFHEGNTDFNVICQYITD